MKAINWFLFFALCAVFFIWFEVTYAAIVCALIAIAVLIYKPVSTVAKDIDKEMDEAEGHVFPLDPWVEGIKEAGSRAGEQLFADNEKVTNLASRSVTKYTFKGSKIGDASRKTVSLFKKIFES